MSKDDKGLPLVLVVDDDILMRLANAQMLDGLARVMMAENSYEAEEMMREHKPALVLLDDIMPHCPSGLSLLEKLQHDEDLCDIPVIMVTASNKDSEIERGLAAGARAYVTKPVDKHVLKAAVIDVLQSRPKNILIIINDEDLSDSLEEMFLRLKSEVVLAVNADHVDIDNLPDLLIVDTLLDAKALRAFEQWKQVPVIILDVDEGEGIDGPHIFMTAPFASYDVAREAGRLIKGK